MFRYARLRQHRGRELDLPVAPTLLLEGRSDGNTQMLRLRLSRLAKSIGLVYAAKSPCTTCSRAHP